eukprot:c27127_g1_i2 orf=320-1066(+)
MMQLLPGAAALATFCGQDNLKREFSDELRRILEVTAWTGKYWHEWSMLKILLSFRLKQVLTDYGKSENTVSGAHQTLATGETFDELVKRLEEGLDSFVDGPPFTLQRLCEILLHPQSIYPNIDKASLALEKMLLVSSTVPICKDPYPSFSAPNEPNNEKTMQQWQHSFEAEKANGIPEERILSDMDMVDSNGADDNPVEGNKVKSMPTSFSSDDEQTAGKAPMHNETLVEDDLVDIALGDGQRSPTDS